jgi:hypothetical protein
VSEYEPGTCVLVHRTEPERPRAATDGYLCRGHSSQLYDALTSLATYPIDADIAAYDETVSAGMGAPTTGTKTRPLPINEQRVDHAIHARKMLASWTQMVAEERGVAVPDVPDLRVTTGFLRRHHLWIVEREWVNEYADEVLELNRRAWSLLNPSGVRRIEIGPCREVFDDGPCAGVLSALVRKSDDLLPSSIQCSGCSVEITADRWLTYGKAMREAA